MRAGNASPIHVFQGHTSWVHDVALPNHNVPTLLSCAGDKTVRVWDIVAMRQRAVLTGHEYRVWGVDVSPDASFAVSCSTDATVRAWPMHEGHVGEAHVFEGHRDSVLSVAVASHAGLVVSGCEDGSVFVWDCNGLFGRTRSVPQLIDLGDTRPTPVQEPSAIPPQLDTDPLVMEVPSPTPDQISAIVVEQTPLKVTPDSPIFPKTAPPVITSHSPILAKAAGHVITPNSPIATKKAPLFVTPKSPMSSGVASPILNETDQLRAAIAMGTERSQRFDKSAAELVRALTRVQDLEKAVGEADARVKGRDAEIARLRAQVVARDSEVGALRAELLATKALVQAGEVHQLLVDNPRKADVCLDYEEPVNKIGAVSDQLSALAARLDAMIATN